MRSMHKGELSSLTDDFVPAEFLHESNDPYFLRNSITNPDRFRDLKADEIETLVKNMNTAQNWNKIQVTDNFNPALVRSCEFLGMVRIGDLEENFLEYHDIRLPVGLSNCVIESCDIGNNVVLRNIAYIAHYIIKDECILFNIDEMITTNHAKFGVGVVKDGEPESVRIWLELGNENGGRAVLPFSGMLSADAYLWSKFRGNTTLMERLKELTEKTSDTQRGYYGCVENRSVIKNSRIIKDVNIGSDAYIKGANKLKNLTILSSGKEPTQIGEGVELVNGIVGYGARVFYGCKGVRFIMDRNTQLKYGARLINSYLGANSTVSCCEILNNLIFPFHEQHHNNSFLIATTVMGQSNIAASATIGSNHNSRSPDGEITAGRGFWPGLCSNFKHNSRFASFVLVSKGNYRYELNIKIPFSLVSQNIPEDRLQVMPAYWFLYNMYAIARNDWKFAKRDKRAVKEQNIEMNVLAPDTVEEMFSAIDLLLPAIGHGIVQYKGNKVDENIPEKELTEIANDFLNTYQGDEQLKRIENKIKVHLDGFENSRKYTEILKPISGVLAYKDMILYYAMTTLLEFLQNEQNQTLLNKVSGLSDLSDLFTNPFDKHWWNLGGQLVYQDDLDELIGDINSKKLDSWQDIHQRYHALWKIYPFQKASHACFSLQRVLGKSLTELANKDWVDLFQKTLDIQIEIENRTRKSREKDFINDFRKMVYENDEEMKAVIGNPDDDGFLEVMRDKTVALKNNIDVVVNQYYRKKRE